MGTFGLSMKSPKPLHKLLRGSSLTLSGVVDRANELAALNAALSQLLDPTLAAHCRVANLRRDTLILQADSPAWAARLRYQIPALLKTLRGARSPKAALRGLEEIQIKIRPPARRPPVKVGRQARMSPSAARLIDAAAQCMDDAPLQSALHRLASRARHGRG